MTTLKQRLEAATAYRPLAPSTVIDIRYSHKADIVHKHREFGRQAENFSLQPILAALIECVEALEPLTNAGLARITPLDSQVEKAFEALANLEKVIGGEGE